MHTPRTVVRATIHPASRSQKEHTRILSVIKREAPIASPIPRALCPSGRRATAGRSSCPGCGACGAGRVTRYCRRSRWPGGWTRPGPTGGVQMPGTARSRENRQVLGPHRPPGPTGTLRLFISQIPPGHPSIYQITVRIRCRPPILCKAQPEQDDSHCG